MADGLQSVFGFPVPVPTTLRPGAISIDLFAGGGGASVAMRDAIGIEPALAYNHDEWAIGLHAANHPMTTHHREDIWHADPLVDVAGRLIDWFHASPDCTHFSQAKGGQPRNGKIRSLSWVVCKWIGILAKAGNAPLKFTLENVWQIRSWGPLIAKRDKVSGRVLKMDGSIAESGERVPRELQQLIPDKKRAGTTFKRFISILESFGYVIDYRKLRACDFGAGTSRERLFMIGRRDGAPIAWPEPTHGKGRLPFVPAADCIDWSVPSKSIFDRPKPLADSTMRRIAKGVMKHVIEAKEPFFITEHANASSARTWSNTEPLRTICANVKGGHFALVTAFLERACAGYYSGSGNDLREPVGAICAKGSFQRLVSVSLSEPSPDQHEKAMRVAAFLITYYGNGQPISLHDPLDTITCVDRMGLVTVILEGSPFVITDIHLRMLKPHELFKAQGFPSDYIIDRTADGRRVNVKQAVRMVGNSVSPPPLAALVRANSRLAA